MDFYKKHFGKRLKSILDERGLSQAELAEMVGVNISMVSRWVNGHDFPSEENAALVSQELGIALEDIAGSIPEIKSRPSLAVDRRVIRQLVDDPGRVPLSALVRLLEEFQASSRVRRAMVLATLFDDHKIAQFAQDDAKHPKTR